MKRIICLFSVLFLTGCAAMGIDQRIEERSEVFGLKVTSNPADAEIYINDRLVARTPAENVPLAIQYNYWVNPLALGGVSYGMKDSYILRVSKSGYENAVEPIVFKDAGQAYIPAKTEYHFELKELGH